MKAAFISKKIYNLRAFTDRFRAVGWVAEAVVLAPLVHSRGARPHTAGFTNLGSESNKIYIQHLAQSKFITTTKSSFLIIKLLQYV